VVVGDGDDRVALTRDVRRELHALAAFSGGVGGVPWCWDGRV
jgi:hypothetical protein